MSVAIAARFFGVMTWLWFALAVVERGANKISERFPSPVSFRAGHGIGSCDHRAQLQRGHDPKKPGL